VTSVTASYEGIRRGELPPGSHVGGYRIDGILGEGGMATLYAATHAVIGKRVALKVMHAPLSFDPIAVERFKIEARAVNAIDHPNIVDVFAFGELPDGRCYLVMELLSGETLYQLLERRRVRLDEAIAILEQVSEALAAAHGSGVIHRDVKPENLFVLEMRGDRRPVKLLDFGVAKLVGGLHASRLTETGCVMGTPLYMSPEQICGRGVDGRADVYSLGVVAYEMLTGAVPFSSASTFEVAQLHFTQKPAPLRAAAPGVPAALDALVLRMLAKEAAERPTMAEVMAEVRAIRLAPGRPPAREPRRWLALALAVLALGGAVGWRVLDGPQRAGAPTHARVVPRVPATSDALPVLAAADEPSVDGPPIARAAPPASVRSDALSARVRKVGRRHGRDYVLDPFNYRR
jgi:serine/threonine-protein kinase